MKKIKQTRKEEAKREIRQRILITWSFEDRVGFDKIPN
jgi:hypothetical protein